jgi:hypothetical protein
VVEADRPNRRTRRRGKSDTIDALAAARAVQSGEARGTPKRTARWLGVPGRIGQETEKHLRQGQRPLTVASLQR